MNTLKKIQLKIKNDSRTWMKKYRESKLEKRASRIKIDEEKPIYYIIRRKNKEGGFFSNYYWVLGHVVCSIEHGYIPVVDMKNYPTLYNERCAVNGERNAWNYYFENLNGVSLEKAYHSRNYVLSESEYLYDYAEKYCIKYTLPSEKTIEFYYPVISQYLKIKPDIRVNLEKEFADNIRADFNEVLGIHYRGTDMRRVNNVDHFRTAALEKYIAEVSKYVERNPEICLFLATDEESVVDEFKSTFKGLVRTTSSFRATDQNSEAVHTDEKHERKQHRYLLGLEVLRDAYFLSMCDSLLCGYSNVSSVAILWNGGKYKELKIITEEE